MWGIIAAVLILGTAIAIQAKTVLMPEVRTETAE
jgi:hypothetical protein